MGEQGKIIREGSEKTDPRLIADYLEKLGLEEMTVDFESSLLTPCLLKGFKERGMDSLWIDVRIKPYSYIKGQ